MIGAESFRVTTSRCGDHHSFTSKEIEFEAGGALQETYDVKPKMRKCAVTVRVDVIASLVVIGTQCNAEELSRRHKKVRYSGLGLDFDTVSPACPGALPSEPLT